MPAHFWVGLDEDAATASVAATASHIVQVRLKWTGFILVVVFYKQRSEKFLQLYPGGVMFFKKPTSIALEKEMKK